MARQPAHSSRPVGDQPRDDGDQPIIASTDGLVRDGRERLLRDRRRAFTLPNPTIESVATAAREEFRGVRSWRRQWKYRDRVAKVRNTIRLEGRRNGLGNLAMGCIGPSNRRSMRSKPPH